jgi:hypothetical protein
LRSCAFEEAPAAVREGSLLEVTRHPVLGGRAFYTVLCPRWGACGEFQHSSEKPITAAGKH